MDKQLKAKWVKALRSGKYKQVREHLYRDGGYCCIGVFLACNYGKRQQEVYRVGYTAAESIIGGANCDNLVEMNDGRGKFIGNAQSFEQIADYIEANL